ncbi:MGMT family protein [Kingella bonacorsii]|uniref:MGMT family protein n=1 Tax=Kingella bonacorsii TaxID=2796361 RepID=A0ABS1BRH2_9NEIS|nr:MGMT family protein [Kingella bonacorsii]MBK0395885.1 MGMT family protein [Kingella bonacorsii]
MRLKNDRLAYEILSAVAEIPCGKVATYGQIARLIGRDKNARLIGSVLRHAADYGDYPCHRVVNAAGRLVPGWVRQADLLREEGVVLKDESHVCLKTYQWDC